MNLDGQTNNFHTQQLIYSFKHVNEAAKSMKCSQKLVINTIKSLHRWLSARLQYSSANALELLQSCTKLSTYTLSKHIWSSITQTMNKQIYRYPIQPTWISVTFDQRKNDLFPFDTKWPCTYSTGVMKFWQLTVDTSTTIFNPIKKWYNIGRLKIYFSALIHFLY